MTEEDKKLMLLQEEYADVRTQVRDAYEQCQAINLQIQLDNVRLAKIRAGIFLTDNADHPIAAEKFISRIQENEQLLATIKNSLPYLSKKMEELEDKLGDKNELWGRDDKWWIRG